MLLLMTVAINVTRGFSDGTVQNSVSGTFIQLKLKKKGMPKGLKN